MNKVKAEREIQEASMAMSLSCQSIHGKIEKGLKEISPKIIAEYDLVMITTAHSNVDYEMVQKNAKAIFDTKNVTKNLVTKENIEIL